MKSHLSEIKQLYDKDQPEQRGALTRIINTTYDVYTRQSVFIAVPLVMLLFHLVTLNVFTVENVFLGVGGTIGIYYTAHSKMKRYLANRESVWAKLGLLVFFFWFKFGLSSSLAYEFWAVIILMASIWLVVWLVRSLFASKKIAEPIYISGAFEKSAQTVFNTMQQINMRLIQGAVLPEYVNFLGIPLISVIATTGFLIFGETRTGKSLIISALLKYLNYPGKRAVIFDASNNALSMLLAIGVSEERIINLNPFHRDCYEWNFAKSFSNPAITRVFFTNVMRSAKAQTVKNGGDASSNFFETDAANIATQVVETLRRKAVEAGKEPSFGLKELCYICTNRGRLVATLKTYPDIWEEVEDFGDKGEQNLAVYGTLKQVFSGLKPMAEAYYRARRLGRTYDLNDFANSDKIIILGREDQLGGCYLNHWDGSIVQYIVTTILGKPETNETKPVRTMFVLDEFDKLGRIDKVVNISTEGGKYGTCLIIGTQAHGLIKSLYQEMTMPLISSITHIAFLKVGEPDTARFASEYFGNQKVNKPTTGYAEGERQRWQWFTPIKRNVNWVEATRQLFEPSHFQVQEKITGDKELMQVTVDCDNNYYRQELNLEQLKRFIPMKPTEEMERENSKPQSQDTLHFKPLTDAHLTELGLTQLISTLKQETEWKQQEVQVQQEAQQQPPKPPINLEDYSDIDFRDCN